MRRGKCSADCGSVLSRSSSDALLQLGQSRMLQAEQHTEELEVNYGGKKAQQGSDRASVCAPLLQHSANGNRWGTICMQINVHPDVS